MSSARSSVRSPNPAPPPTPTPRRPSPTAAVARRRRRRRRRGDGATAATTAATATTAAAAAHARSAFPRRPPPTRALLSLAPSQPPPNPTLARPAGVAPDGSCIAPAAAARHRRKERTRYSRGRPICRRQLRSRLGATALATFAAAPADLRRASRDVAE